MTDVGLAPAPIDGSSRIQYSDELKPQSFASVSTIAAKDHGCECKTFVKADGRPTDLHPSTSILAGARQPSTPI